ncbi:DUF3952 domain-containing protein [Bacillus thuringiensis]|uniref:DUF3952 domain-containing protein n=11 Tax=Bacillus cereus group TaxID=86661 RepID=A0AAW7NEI5_BACCE|nr:MULTISPECIES: DUF3952 domain-containing protein [Bacillus]EAO54126.1 Hypothetical exported protein [Bacillus thuringiensis serovar israelensis ATCC 35646]OTW85404.1 hypothetical protein BK702_18330 [Bacillus thuringiensis serovar cameroun]AFQ25780.1 hypothetical protein BTF1_07845 [Bacillus thuringiensis HD-789]AJH04055.1 hypothetical protein AS86_1918 [Bacillus thuringiensis HD1002]AND23953.1 hypothetical protein ATN07_10380 [Bacillus thuringiensis serovar israelensis]
MKLKKKAKVMIVVSIVASLLSGCGFGEKQIDYKPFVKALDEGDMRKVMSASDDGYAYVKERVIDFTTEKNGDDRIHNTLYQTTEGIYNLKEKLLYGITSQKITSKTKDIKDRHKDINYKEEEKYNTNFMYKNGKLQGSDSNLDISPVKLIFNRLQGVGNLKLKADGNRKKFNEPNSVGFTLTEAQFQEIINDKLKLQYNKFENASIVLNFNDSIDNEKHPMQITELTISIDYEKKNDEGKMLTHSQQIYVYFSSKKDNNQEAKKEFVNYEKQYKNK